MQFIKDGPDIPELLIEAHEDGRVVFFCGAGISYPAGLPGFSGLIDQLYTTLGTVRTSIEEEAYSRKQYDATLDLLERRIPGQRLAVRKALTKILKPKLHRKGATNTHAALLQLAKGRDGAVRLVTTNFDRIFQHLTKRSKPAIPAYPAPFLPIPKNSRWNGLVYLHGLLREKPDEESLQRLVLSSGDFGLAYLTERWAARFVSELFRNYVVCFVGYSINDPVLRYMMDALAADRMLGESTPLAYAFGDYHAGQAPEKRIEWEAKGVTPILYIDSSNHSALHQTLKAWGDTYRDGVQGRERIVVEYAMTRPLASTRQDDFVGRMLWALSHKSGLPAKRFADFDPVPSLDWLKPLCVSCFRQTDLARFGVPPLPKEDDKLTFSLAKRPTPYTHAPWMNLSNNGLNDGNWDEVMHQLGRWLTRHLDDPELVLWVAKQGGQLHNDFGRLLRITLEKLTKLENQGNTEELDRIRSNAAKAIPGPMMRTVWGLLLTGRVKSPSHNWDLPQWVKRLKTNGLTTTLRLELREQLAPRIALHQPFHSARDEGHANEPQRLKDLIDWEIVLFTDHIHSLLDDLRQDQAWRSALPQLLQDIQLLLHDALDLMRELGGANDQSDPSHWDLPSISPHRQNHGFRDWAVLIELLREAWLITLEHDPAHARRIVENWLEQPYPTFRRFALFAATYDGISPNGEWVNWLLADEAWWLWSVETQRETMRLLILQSANLPLDVRGRLEVGILAGPPRHMFRADLEPEEWQHLVDHTVWLRLAKIRSSISSLSAEAQTKLDLLTNRYPHWQLATNESDEFSIWSSGTGDPDYEDQRQIERAPRKRRDLVNWLQFSQPSRAFHDDDWRDFCREKFSTAACALFALARENKWPIERWRVALQTWSDEKFLKRSWRYLALVVQSMPSEPMLAMAHSISWWLEANARALIQHEVAFLDLCRRLLAIEHQDGMETDRPVQRAINHPVGHVTQALLHYWFRSHPEDGQGLPDDLKPFFTSLCNTQINQYRHGRVLLASNVIALFRVDSAWAEDHLLPLFNWEYSIPEARGAWEGFLRSPRLYRPLLGAFKEYFLKTAHHYSELEEYGQQYAIILTYAALDPADFFTSSELREAIHTLPQEGLQKSVQTLVRSLESAGEQQEAHWTNRILPFWNTIWPQFGQLASKEIAKQLVLLAISARGAFPEAVETVHHWFQPVEHPNYLLRRLYESELCNLYPQHALKLLNAIIADQHLLNSELQDCLRSIVESWPDAPQDSRYRRLINSHG